MDRVHAYETVVTWTGNRGSGTTGYRDYGRDHDVDAEGHPTIAGSADQAFRGDPTRWSPEHLLVASVSQCHMLWYLHLCAVGGVIVTDYVDRAHGTMTETDEGGRFVEVVLRPQITIAAEETVDAALAAHSEAHRRCFIARSVNFPVRVEPTIRCADGGAAGA